MSGWLAVWFAAFSSAPRLAAQPAHPAAMEIPAAQRNAGPEAAHPGSPLREIADPHSGMRWFLFRDREHPGGPGRLVLAAEPLYFNRSLASMNPDAGASARPVVVRPGDRLVIQEHTARYDAWFEASALGSACAGSFLNVRLKFSGKVVRVLITSPGSAVLTAAEAEVRP